MRNVEKLAEKLSQKYDSSNVERKEYFKRQCYGGKNFASTLDLISENDEKIVDSAFNCLNTIVESPNAGSISWEMRRYIRRAPKEYFNIFCDEIKELYLLNNKIGLDMDNYIWAIQQEGKDSRERSFKTIYGFSGWFVGNWFAGENGNEEKHLEFRKRLKKLEPKLFSKFNEKEKKKMEEHKKRMKKLGISF